MLIRLLIFLTLNFGALAIGGLFTNLGVSSEWYASLDKAPWTPPGWVFGMTWFLIMAGLSVFMTWQWPLETNKSLLLTMYGVQWILNVAWNPVFFKFHLIGLGLVVITALTFLMALFVWRYRSTFRGRTLLIMPYLVWLIIATSLNAFIWWNN